MGAVQLSRAQAVIVRALLGPERWRGKEELISEMRRAGHARSQWTKALGELNVKLRQVGWNLVSNDNADHYGLAEILRDSSGQLTVPRTETAKGPVWTTGVPNGARNPRT